jgi:DNA-directed RNA polymerase specialized sigma24 family protein
MSNNLTEGDFMNETTWKSPNWRLREVGKTAVERREAKERWEKAILAAAEIGFTYREIAQVAECSHTMVAKIVMDGELAGDPQ